MLANARQPGLASTLEVCAGDDDQFLLPFLRARKYNVDKAFHVIKNFAKFWYGKKDLINGLCAVSGPLRLRACSQDRGHSQTAPASTASHCTSWPFIKHRAYYATLQAKVRDIYNMGMMQFLPNTKDVNGNVVTGARTLARMIIIIAAILPRMLLSYQA